MPSLKYSTLLYSTLPNLTLTLAPPFFIRTARQLGANHLTFKKGYGWFQKKKPAEWFPEKILARKYLAIKILHWKKISFIWRIMLEKNLTPLYARKKKLYYQAPVLERPISFNPGLKLLFHFLYLPSYALLRKTFCVIITVNLVERHNWFVSSEGMFLDKKTLLKIWLNPGLNWTIFRGTGTRALGKKYLTQTKSLIPAHPPHPSKVK